MPIYLPIPPLQWNVPIVNQKTGTPEPWFANLFAQQNGNASTLNISKQDADDDLTALSTLSGSGLLARTADATFALRTLGAPAAGLSIANPGGIAGNPTFALANDLAALEALSGTHTIYYRSAADTWTPVTIGAGLDFTGATLSSTGGAGSPIEVLDEGVSETASLTSLDFVGAGVSANDDGSGNVTVTVPGGGGLTIGRALSLASVQYSM